MTGNVRWIILFVSLLLVSRVVFADTRAELSSNTAAIDEEIVLSLTSDLELPDDLQLPTVDGLVIQQGSRSNEVSIIQGKVSKKVRRDFHISTSKPGKYVIPSFAIQSGSDTHTVRSIELTFTDQPQGPGHGNAGPHGDTRPNITVDRSVTPQQSPIFVGQAFILTTSVTHKVQLSKANLEGNLPSTLRRIASKETEPSPDVTQVHEALVASSTGSLALAPARLQAGIMVRAQRRGGRGNWLDEMFGHPFLSQPTRIIPTHAESPPLKIQVLPLPPRPNDARDPGPILVGRLEGTASLSQTQLRVGDTANLTINLSLDGGEVSTLQRWAPAVPPHVKVYTSKPTFENEVVIDGTEAQDHRFNSRAVLEYALVPTQAGTITFDPIILPFFDPWEERYTVLALSLPPLLVDGADPASSVPNRDEAPTPSTRTDTTRDAVRTQGEDILGPKSTTSVSSPWLDLAVALRGMMLAGAGVLAVLVARIIQRHRSRAGRRPRRDVALRRLKQSLVGAKSCEEALAAFRTYLSDRVPGLGRNLTLRDLETVLQRLAPSSVAEVLSLAKRVELELYGGNGAPAQANPHQQPQSVSVACTVLLSAAKEVDRRCER